MGDENLLRSVRWLAAGARENESMVVHHLRVLQDDLLRRRPEVESRLYTNCIDVEGWAGSYTVGDRMLPEKTDHVFKIGVQLAVTMYLEEGLRSDLFVSNGLASAWAVYGLGLAMWNTPLPPVVSVMAKAPEEKWDYVTPESATLMLRTLGASETFWLFVLDNANEERIMRELMVGAGHAFQPRIRRVRTYAWDKEPFPEKDDVVVWSGRLSAMKNPNLAADVFALMPEVDKEAFFAREAGQLKPEHKAFAKMDRTRVHIAEPPEVYRELTQRAKVLLITSHAEGLPAGYVELMGQGCLPVVWDRPWAQDVVPPDWPFKFKTAGQGVECVKKAMSEYSRYVTQLQEWMAERFGKPVNFADLVDEVWADYTVRLGDKMRLVAGRGTRKSL